MIKNDFLPDIKLTQQKGRRVPLQSKVSVHADEEPLLHEQHMEKVRMVNDEMFFQPAIFTVEEDESVYIALKTKELNRAIAMDKSDAQYGNFVRSGGRTAR